MQCTAYNGISRLSCAVLCPGLACAPDGNGSAVPALAVPGLQPAACVHANGDLPSGQEAEMEGDEEILYRPSPHHVPSGSVGAQVRPCLRLLLI